MEPTNFSLIVFGELAGSLRWWQLLSSLANAPRGYLGIMGWYVCSPAGIGKFAICSWWQLSPSLLNYFEWVCDQSEELSGTLYCEGRISIVVCGSCIEKEREKERILQPLRVFTIYVWHRFSIVRGLCRMGTVSTLRFKFCAIIMMHAHWEVLQRRGTYKKHLKFNRASFL